VDEATLQAPGATRIVVDDERQLPAGREAVGGTEFDLRSPRQVGALRLDHGFCDLERDAEGHAWVRLTGADGRTVSLWCDESYSLVQLYTGDTLAPERRRRGLAAEPMTCPANALQTGEGIVRLEPGQSHVCRWGVRLS
jgi:aldose 1-epimerase